MSKKSLQVATQLSQEAFDLSARAAVSSAGTPAEATTLALLAIERRLAVVGVILDARIAELADRQ